MKAREAAVLDFKFAEEEILQKIEQEKKEKIEREAVKTTQKISNSAKPPRPGSAKENLRVRKE